MSPPNRFCTQCGAPLVAVPGATHCARCGTVLASATRTAPDDAGSARSRLPSLAIGLIACTTGGFLFLVCGGIIAAIAVPNFVKAQARSKAVTARANLRTLWAAEQSWAHAHGGEFLEFYVEPYDTGDPNFQRLSVELGAIHHSYEGYYDGEVFVIAATGNIDTDVSVDEWELTSDDPEPLHIYDDITEVSDYGEPTYDAQYEPGVP